MKVIIVEALRKITEEYCCLQSSVFKSYCTHVHYINSSQEYALHWTTWSLPLRQLDCSLRLLYFLYHTKYFTFRSVAGSAPVQNNLNFASISIHFLKKYLGTLSILKSKKQHWVAYTTLNSQLEQPAVFILFQREIIPAFTALANTELSYLGHNFCSEELDFRKLAEGRKQQHLRVMSTEELCAAVSAKVRCKPLIRSGKGKSSP